MIPELAALIFLAVGASLTVWSIGRWRRQRVLRRVARNTPTYEAPARLGGRVLWRAYAVPWVLGVVLAAVLHFAFRMPWVYSVAISLLASLLGGQVEAMWAQWRINQIEVQLADLIDLVVGSLQAGAGVLKSLESGVREIAQPLRGPMEEVAGRIRLGDDASEVFDDLAARVPLETFFLFTSALSVHWETGGSLAPTLATVGRTIRDRIELSRRVRSMSAQARASTIGVLISTYAIAAIMWANDPPRMERFVRSELGSILVSCTLVLQAVGIVWSSALGRIKF